MIRIYLFTYAGDADEALVCVRCAAAALPEAVITVVDDESTPIAERARTALVEAGARYCQTSWPRNGNLRGPECVRGIISTLAREAEDDDVIVKIDSDTLLLSGDWVRDMRYTGLVFHASGYQVPSHPSERSAYGPCYAISGWAARLAAEELEQADLPPLAPEDLTICRAVQNHFPTEQIRLDEPWTPIYRDTDGYRPPARFTQDDIPEEQTPAMAAVVAALVGLGEDWQAVQVWARLKEFFAPEADDPMRTLETVELTVEAVHAETGGRRIFTVYDYPEFIITDPAAVEFFKFFTTSNL